MLNRQSFFKTVMAVGAGLLLPSGRSNETLPFGSVRIKSMTWLGPCDCRESHTPQPRYRFSVRARALCRSVGRLGLYRDSDETSVSRNSLDVRRHQLLACPLSFLYTTKFHSLEVGPEYFNCDWCDATGSAIDCYARIEGLSHTEASGRLEGLLNEGNWQAAVLSTSMRGR